MQNPQTQPLFASAEEAWLWVASFRMVDRGGPRPPRRCCRSEDLLALLEELYRSGQLDVDDAHILRVFGEKQRAPEERRDKEATAAVRWQRLMRLFGAKMRQHGWLARDLGGFHGG